MSAEIAAVATAMCAAWTRRDAQASYLAAENAARLIGPEAIRAYLTQGCRALECIDIRPGKIHARALGEALGLAFFPMTWKVQAKDRAPFGGDLRVTMLMRKIGGAWRLFLYAEAPLAPIIQLQRFYEGVAADGFPS
jgi:hypothetical protein